MADSFALVAMLRKVCGHKHRAAAITRVQAGMDQLGAHEGGETWLHSGCVSKNQHNWSTGWMWGEREGKELG